MHMKLTMCDLNDSKYVNLRNLYNGKAALKESMAIKGFKLPIFVSVLISSKYLGQLASDVNANTEQETKFQTIIINLTVRNQCKSERFLNIF